MSLNWQQYGLVYYLTQWLLLPLLYIILVILIPYDLMDWIGETLFCLEDKDVNETEDETGERAPEKSTAKDQETQTDGTPQNQQNQEGSNKNSKCLTYGKLFHLSWLCKRRQNNKETSENIYKQPYWCICDHIWEAFGGFFGCTSAYLTCCKQNNRDDNTGNKSVGDNSTPYGNAEGNNAENKNAVCAIEKSHGYVCSCCDEYSENCLINSYHFCCECNFTKDDLSDKNLPFKGTLYLSRRYEKWYCGWIYCNLNRIAMYLILTAAVWCAVLVFFEDVILAYTNKKGGDSCPVPQYGTAKTVVDCFFLVARILPDQQIQIVLFHVIKV